VACRRFGNLVASIGLLNEDVWVGLAYGRQLLVHLPKRAFYDVPKSAWTALSISAEERKEMLDAMSLRDKAVYALYAGDMKRLARLLEKLTPGSAEGANRELMLLAAFAYGPSGVDDPVFARAWCVQIIAHYPDSPWSSFAQKELDEGEQNHKIRQHQDWLLTKFDLNHDGVLDDAEKRAMEKSSEFQREERRSREELLLPQLQALVKRYGHDGDGKLSRRELELVKARVALFLETSSERLERERAYVAPLLTKEFPSVEKLLQKYDANHDGALDVTELKAFAEDIRR
jgi:Ca2+-binding EF-hand superfamily protein